MPNPIADAINEKASLSLEYNLSQLRDKLRAPRNSDIITRRFSTTDFACAIMFIDGMVKSETINRFVMEPILRASAFSGDPNERIYWLTNTVLSVSALRTAEEMDDAIEAVLMGDLVLLVDGCAEIILIDVKGFEKRTVGKPINETVIMGPHEAFVENMRVNMTLLRRMIRSPRLVAEQVKVGNGISVNCMIVYLDGVMNEQILQELRRRLENINQDFVMATGELEQLIEDSPYSLFPQMILTERPDRAASFLISGMAVVMVEGSPMVIGAPASLMHLFQTPDLIGMRFPYGVFKRFIIAVGVFFSSLLPALYLSITQFHTDMLSLAMITSIYETEARIPLPMIFGLFVLSIGFDLILEAGSRMPGVLSNGLGAVSGLIIGQAVVAAELVSTLMIIVVAVAGLGTLILPEYNMTIAIRMYQFFLLFAAAIGGMFGVFLALLLLLMELCNTTSLGVPLMWSYTPGRMHNPDNLSRYPLWQQRIRAYFANPVMLFRSIGRMRAWDQEDQGEQ